MHAPADADNDMIYNTRGNGMTICIDSIHEGTRAMHLLDAGHITKRSIFLMF